MLLLTSNHVVLFDVSSSCWCEIVKRQHILFWHQTVLGFQLLKLSMLRSRQCVLVCCQAGRSHSKMLCAVSRSDIASAPTTVPSFLTRHASWCNTILLSLLPSSFGVHEGINEATLAVLTILIILRAAFCLARWQPESSWNQFWSSPWLMDWWMDGFIYISNVWNDSFYRARFQAKIIIDVSWQSNQPDHLNQ